VLASIASGSEWLVAVVFAPAAAIIIIGLLRRRLGSPEPPMAASPVSDDAVVRISPGVLISEARWEHSPDQPLEPTRRRRRVKRPVDEPNWAAEEPHTYPEEPPRHRGRHNEAAVNGGTRPSQSGTRIDDRERASWLGSILWNPPSQMRMGNSERIEVRLGEAEQAIDARCEDCAVAARHE
jgi:hypothetical protein